MSVLKNSLSPLKIFVKSKYVPPGLIPESFLLPPAESWTWFSNSLLVIKLWLKLDVTLTRFTGACCLLEIFEELLEDGVRDLEDALSLDDVDVVPDGDATAVEDVPVIFLKNPLSPRAWFSVFVCETRWLAALVFDSWCEAMM